MMNRPGSSEDSKVRVSLAVQTSPVVAVENSLLRKRR